MSTKTATVEDQIEAELEALRVEDEARAKRVARIVSLQLPIMERCLDVLATKPPPRLRRGWLRRCRILRITGRTR